MATFMSVTHLGEPLTTVYSIPGGQARLFERGLTINADSGEVIVSFAFPMIGRPSIPTGNTGSIEVFEIHAIRFALGLWQPEQLTPLIKDALAGRLSMLGTGRSDLRVPLILGQPIMLNPEDYAIPVTADILQERQLYDVALRAEGDQWHVVAPHAVYYRKEWTDFGIAHITDLHVARRIDSFRGLLVQAGRMDGARRLYNWNDRFRGFIRYANFLHSIDKLDVIISTGDQYDYIYEDDDDKVGGGNATFIRQLIQGTAPGPDFPDVEELRVPIFMIPGNHDYRKHPYKLIFDLHIGKLGIGKDIERIKNFTGYNLPQKDAQVLESLLDKLPDIFGTGQVVNVSPEGAARMVEVDREIKAYKEVLSDRESYIIQLGSHRIAMLNSGPDEGMMTGYMDGLRKILGSTSEDEDTFLDGSPNSEGISDEEYNMVSEALAGTPEDGLFIIGLHAPLVNPDQEEYPYFLRQTQRPEHPEQVLAFLARHDGAVNDPEKVEQEEKSRHPSWFPTEGDHRDPTFIKRQDNQDMLDFAVSRGRAGGLIQLLARGSAIIGWGAWQNVSEGMCTPGGHVAAIATNDEKVTLFLADPNGGVYANSGNFKDGWGTWQSVSEGSTTPGAPVAAVWNEERVTLVLADPNGGIYANEGTYQSGWGGWQSVSEGSTTPGGHVSAVSMGSRISLSWPIPMGVSTLLQGPAGPDGGHGKACLKEAAPPGHRLPP